MLVGLVTAAALAVAALIASVRILREYERAVDLIAAVPAPARALT